MLMVSSCGTNESKENIDSIVEKMLSEKHSPIVFNPEPTPAFIVLLNLMLNFLFKSTPKSGETDKVLSAKSIAAIMLIGFLIEILTFCASFKSFGSLTTINAGVGSGLNTMGECFSDTSLTIRH
jgi:hypothetical protein